MSGVQVPQRPRNSPNGGRRAMANYAPEPGPPQSGYRNVPNAAGTAPASADAISRVRTPRLGAPTVPAGSWATWERQKPVPLEFVPPGAVSHPGGTAPAGAAVMITTPEVKATSDSVPIVVRTNRAGFIGPPSLAAARLRP